ncbi:hypothetical protein CAPTEDRAFT_136407 [Capitella teleta]|uniref:Alpha-amylase n=1 Tax=Capitella teleta TaxID=283909 RepID=R7UA95_CAPTE|nr:hypothetical protein CAPTEDRAFT_136407 [Capitella teleta]|eukprot:ELU03285.1 hypothetical protein CAPTEDRAFT_136407 [Capitella teleta]
MLIAYFIPGEKSRSSHHNRDKHDYHDDTCVSGRTVIVHLFDWKWTDIAAECERFLGPKGFCGVQVSPPNEHLVITSPHRPWYERYQPVSYKLESRSGTRGQFADMVKRCNAAQVRIYVDAVINHMSASGHGVGTGGSAYNTMNMSYAGVPYSALDFNYNCEINNYNDINQVRNCKLVGLQDLALSKRYVREKIADYLNDLISLGVAGFRVDACKHMWPGDIEAIYSLLQPLNITWFGPGTKPFVFNEVIDKGGGVISASEYTHLGRVTEFRFCDEVGKAFRRQFMLKNLRTIGEAWAMLPSDKALVFVDNHDNQRGHGGGGSTILTFHNPREYKMAVAFMLAHPYGFTRIMSSHVWNISHGQQDWMGPPSYDNDTTKTVTLDNEGQCLDGWVCEHRWPAIASMVKFRNVADGQPLENWFDNGFDQIAFSRGRNAFIAINNEVVGDLHRELPTGMATGSYCDVISGELVNGECTGQAVHVDQDGVALITISSLSNPPIPMTEEKPKKNDVEQQGSASSLEEFQETVVMVHFRSGYGQDLFIRGGVDTEHREGCTENTASNPCSIAIRYNSLGDMGHHVKFNAWRTRDTKLDWYGAEPDQARFYNQVAMGSPALWTTNEEGHDGYQPINRFGPNVWMWKVEMNCSQTDAGWFEFKCFVSNLAENGGWEHDIHQPIRCSGTAEDSRRPRSSNNHFARCGHTNTFDFDRAECRIDVN